MQLPPALFDMQMYSSGISNDEVFQLVAALVDGADDAAQVRYAECTVIVQAS